MTLLKRPDGMSDPSGIANQGDDPYPCDGCQKYIEPGQPFWGGGADYFGEANSVYCERCEIEAFEYAEKQCAEWDRKMDEPCEKCGLKIGEHIHYGNKPCKSIAEWNREYMAAKAAKAEQAKA